MEFVIYYKKKHNTNRYVSQKKKLRYVENTLDYTDKNNRKIRENILELVKFR